MEQESTITIEQLLADGWVKTDDPVFPIKKCLSDTEHEDYDPEESDIELVLHRMVNVNMFAVCLPDGGLLNLNPASIEDLQFIEKQIIGFMPYY